jgi:hypothetical protein
MLKSWHTGLVYLKAVGSMAYMLPQGAIVSDPRSRNRTLPLRLPLPPPPSPTLRFWHIWARLAVLCKVTLPANFRVGRQQCSFLLGQCMDQISIKTPNPKGRLFVKLYLYRDLAAGVYLSEAPSRPWFLFKVIKQFSGFGIWSNTQCIIHVQ